MSERYTCFNCGRTYDPVSFVERKSYFATGMCHTCQVEAFKKDFDLLDRLKTFREKLVTFQAEGVVSVHTWGVLLDEKVFRQYFGDGPDLTRQKTGGGFIRESKIYEGTEFATLMRGENQC